MNNAVYNLYYDGICLYDTTSFHKILKKIEWLMNMCPEMYESREKFVIYETKTSVRIIKFGEGNKWDL
jgi:hypothetical protein